MSYDMIAILMFASMMLMLFTGQRVFGASGVGAAGAALARWGQGGSGIPFSAAKAGSRMTSTRCSMSGLARSRGGLPSARSG